MNKIASLFLVQVLLVGFSARAFTPVTVIGSKYQPRVVSSDKIVENLKNNLDVNHYRAVKGQVIYNKNGQPDHLLIYLFKIGFHSVEFATVNLDSEYNFTSKVQEHVILPEDQNQQNGDTAAAVCPDPSIQFIAFAPNTDDLEQQTTIEVATAAKAAGLKTISLLEADATRQAYLNYMSCPNLVGNFYDGDANTSEMVTVDGMINATDFSTVMKGALRFKVTNIWLACEAYNDPMLSAVTVDAQSQKYAAGINDLEVGPSDKTGACAMEAAIKGQPMTAAFQNCYKTLDVSTDQWGFGGTGSDTFGQ